MRRSGAPSLKNKTTCLFDLKVRTNITQPKSNNDPKNECSQLKEKTENSNTTDKEVFSVVWGKRTTKKHKTYENDGIIEILNNTGTLRDLSGNYLGNINKLTEIYEGNKLVIGGKEVEVLEKLINQSTFTYKPKDFSQHDTTEEKYDEAKGKKRKSNNIFVPNLHLSAPPIKMPKLPKKDDDVELVDPLVMEEPSNVHHLKFNQENRPVIEVQISTSIAKYLRPHQREGVKFLYECVFGLRNMDYFGAILADEMGLGKTLQCLALCHTLLKRGPYGGERVLGRVLIVTPSSLVETWNREISKWLGRERMFAYVVDAKNKISQFKGQKHMPFVIVSYETFVTNADEFRKMSFDMLICDEGHRLKNQSTKIYGCLMQLGIQKRIIVTGTPIQNDLQEFYALVNFVNPGILGDYQKYKRQYENPIVLSQAPNASSSCKSIGNEKAEELKFMTSKFIIRRTQSVNIEYLPTKKEFVIFVRPSELQISLIEKALQWYEIKEDLIAKESVSLQMITAFKKICNHPNLITRSSKNNAFNAYLKSLLSSKGSISPSASGKLELVTKMLKQIIALNEKVVLVSNHTKMLDMLMSLCDQSQYKYLRLDGATQPTERNSIVEKFNKPLSDFNVFLLSSKAGGVGLNLCGASKLILFDCDWNPATDLQAMSRIWRDGQTKDVQIFRLVTCGTIEEKIFQRQIQKISLTGCVINQPDGKSALKFSEEDLTDLFSIQENFESCETHDILECNCEGNGEIPSEDENLDEEDDPFQIKLTDATQEKQLQLNELKKWEHYKPPFREDFLKDISMLNAEENVLFIFGNQTNTREIDQDSVNKVTL